MRKILTLFFVLSIFLISCNQDYSINENKNTYLPSTEVYVQGDFISNYSETRSHGYGDAWPHTDDGWDAARFSVRIDGNIPGINVQSSTDYWGGFSGPNLGKVSNIYPYGLYDDRGYDYYKVDKATGNNIGLFRYVFDSDGVQTLNAIQEIPDVRTFLTYVRDNSTKTKDINTLNSVLSSEQPLKVIWYIAKEVGLRYGWHVNGVLTCDTVENVLEIPGIKQKIEKDIIQYGFEESDANPESVANNVEIDIHLQKHQDWNEIKTSIHVRQDAGNISVNIPLEYENIVEAENFTVRYYHYYYRVFDITHEIIHNDNGISINISGIDPEFINTLKSKFGDGLTIEIHSFCKSIDGVWNQIKQSSVTTQNTCNINGQITSAYDADDKVIFGE